MMHNLISFNHTIFFHLHELVYRSEIIRVSAYVIAEHMDLYIILLSVIFLSFRALGAMRNGARFFSKETLKEGVLVFCAVMIAWCISFMLKNTIELPRPFLTFPDVTPLFVYGGYNSFPSGHATLFAALGTMIFFFHKKVGIFFIAWAVLIGLSRIIVGIHFPLDVLFGWILGSFVAWGVYRVFSRYYSS